ncbi:MAG: 4-hydroxy-3-methylbut-2-enyl diphosphate reductase [Candidatus Atribacteria bacterium]|nr:4-hydroxy-3-methylbut-2-enyl diphosphate reductase [Candidatus Atribacteria bacterium]
MKILIAKHIGFCPGVKRAYNMALQAFETRPHPVYLLGELVHNHQAVKMLVERGACLVNEVEEIPNQVTVVTRSHGLERETRRKLLGKGINIVDTTCPRVQKVQVLASELEKKGYTIIILGDPNHAEIKALISELNTKPIVLGKDSIEWDEKLSPLPKSQPLAVIEQTTFPQQQYRDFCRLLEEKKLTDRCQIYNTLCPETEYRQNELFSHLQTGKIDTVVILGGKHSSNTRGLYLVANQHAPRTIWIEDPNEVRKSWFQPNQTILIVSGASTPDHAVKELIKKIQ